MIETTWNFSPIRRSMSIGGISYDFAYLGEYRDLRFELHGLQQNSASTVDFVLQFGTDNGVTWDTTPGNYVEICGVPLATPGAGIVGSFAPATQIAGLIEIANFNSSYPAEVIPRCGRLGSNVGTRTGPVYHTPLVARNAIRLLAGVAFSKNLGIVLRARRF